VVRLFRILPQIGLKSAFIPGDSASASGNQPIGILPRQAVPAHIKFVGEPIKAGSIVSIPEEIALAKEHARKAEELLKGKYASDPRTSPLLGYVDLVFEHHHAMMLLLKNDLPGSAFSLVRVQFEAFINAHWTSRCATAGQVLKIAAKVT
jgi:hypothetical protein